MSGLRPSRLGPGIDGGPAPPGRGAHGLENLGDLPGNLLVPAVVPLPNRCPTDWTERRMPRQPRLRRRRGKNLDDVDLSGTRIGLINIFPSNLSAGNWTVGVVVNEDASDEQLDAIDRIMRGQEGGPFEMFASLYGKYLGTERGEVTFTDGDTPSFSIRGNSFTFEPLPGPEGSDSQTDGEERRLRLRARVPGRQVLGALRRLRHRVRRRLRRERRLRIRQRDGRRGSDGARLASTRSALPEQPWSQRPFLAGLLPCPRS